MTDTTEEELQNFGCLLYKSGERFRLYRASGYIWHQKKNLIKKRIIAVYIILFTVKFYSFEENSNFNDAFSQF